MLMIITLLVSMMLDKQVTCNASQAYNLRNLCTEQEDQVLYCFEYHKRVEYSVECAGMCLNHKSPAWDDEFLNSQGACSLFAYNDSSILETNCMLCLLLNGGEVYEINTGRIVGDYVFLNSNPATSMLFPLLVSKMPFSISIQIYGITTLNVAGSVVIRACTWIMYHFEHIVVN